MSNLETLTLPSPRGEGDLSICQFVHNLLRYSETSVT
jgi:hypothetical protein